jgi:hypothetical protein
MLRAVAGSAMVLLLLASPAGAQAKDGGAFNADHVIVRFHGITEAQAESLGRVAEAARAATIARYGFDVPAKIKVNVDCKPGNKTRLFTDGHDTYTLSISDSDQLAPPAESGVFNLYGMCHELGHVVMYRVIKDHSWLKDDAAEGWAHYFGSRIVDDVYAAEGKKIWWQAYDFRTEGMARMREEQGAARAWMELVDLVGEKKMPALFAAWGKAKIDATNPSPALLAAVNEVAPQNSAKIAQWWRANEPLLVNVRKASKFVPASAPAKPGQPKELAHDDGKSKGKSSIAGSGHVVAFEAPGDGCRLTAVKIFGSRYGAPQPPAEDFHVFLCDGDGNQIKDLPFPYKTFLRGGERWVTLKLDESIELPKNFIVCVSFNPTASKGVFVHFDEKLDGDSRTGLPGNLNDAFNKGDWMIRAVIDLPRD